MDYMDIDQVLDVPDTPDRIAVQKINGRGFIEKESGSSVAGHPGNADIFDERIPNRLRGRNKLVIGNGHSRNLSVRPSRNLNISEKSEGHSNSTVSALKNSSSSRSALLFRRMGADKAAKYENKHPIHSQHTEKGKALCTSQSYAHKEDNAVVDLTEQNGHARVFEEALSCGALGNYQAEEIRKGSISANGFSSLDNIENSPKTSSNSCKGKEKVDDTCKGGSGFDRGKGIDFFGDSQSKSGNSMPASRNSITSPRVIGQKRLVRNGCISPHNIAKAKQLAEKHDNHSIDFVESGTGALASNGPPSLIDVRDLVAEDNNSYRVKGKGIMVHPFLSEEPDAKAIHLSGRSLRTHNEKEGTDDARRDAFRCFEGLGGWRSTRNRTKKIELPSYDEGQHLSSRKDDLCFVDQHHENGVVRRDNGHGSSNWTDNEYPKDRDAVSCQHVSAPPAAQSASHIMSRLGQFDESRHAAKTLIKRQKQGSSSSNHGKFSKSGIDDSEIMFLGSSGEPSNSRSTRNLFLGNRSTRNQHHGLGISDPVIEIDEFSPGIRQTGSHNVNCSSNDSDARARQVEADEMLARELQEQLYNEMPGVGEIDAHIALALQQEDSQQAFSSGSHRVFRPRGTSHNPSVRRGTQARVPTSTRMARLRGQLPGQTRAISSGETLFPPNMDMDMRIHILEALEAFSDMGMGGNFLQVQRDFNENDYEMLLALDENNHHAGASLNLINGLPESTVQTDNFEEACAICLETPTTGDTIRHLPCLHKFHKDCIDPWLKRRTSCPVCKSSIT
uniref:RING-type domain-containing protein n=1 Tax=Davidia involucrata TaxID=16924 RepID=A0A5B7BXQ2_DAVIN